jgi:hypothetical protein
MAAVSNPEEVYKKYIDRFGLDADGDPDAIALFSYALVERDRFDWMDHHRREHGDASPSDAEVRLWFESKPESYFDDKYKLALAWYSSFARSLLAPDIEKSNKDAIKEYIGDKMGYPSQIMTGLFVNFLFAIVVALISVFVLTDFSQIAWVKRHFPGPQAPDLPAAPPPSAAAPK